MEADIIRSGANEVTASPASDWLRDIRDISGSLYWILLRGIVLVAIKMCGIVDGYLWYLYN